MFLKKVILIVLLLFLYNCKSTKVSKKIYKSVKSSFYSHQFTGILVYNPDTKDTLVNYNAHKYFTPASNTKIFTLYTALKILPKKVIAFSYQTNHDTLYIKGVGNPTFLHSFFKDSTAIHFVKKYAKTYLITQPIADHKYGGGWAWEDYDRYFSPERSNFPMYGNVATIYKKEHQLKVIPKVLASKVSVKTHPSFRRSYAKNNFFYPSKGKDTIEIPMVLSDALTHQLWQSLVPNKVAVSHQNRPTPKRAFTKITSDSLYQRMLYVSDNFLAEQMLLMASSTLSDTLNTKKIRKYMLTTFLNDLQEKPRWVDGSGLSRYNLFTPTSFVQVLEKLYYEIPKERLFKLFPIGGQSGTLKKWYHGNPTPYIFAKSGTLGNNYSLSGYLKTNSGKILIFSFMNNHHKKQTSEIKKHMQEIFEWLRDNY